MLDTGTHDRGMLQWHPHRLHAVGVTRARTHARPWLALTSHHCMLFPITASVGKSIKQTPKQNAQRQNTALHLLVILHMFYYHNIYKMHRQCILALGPRPLPTPQHDLGTTSEKKRIDQDKTNIINTQLGHTHHTLLMTRDKHSTGICLGLWDVSSLFY